MSLVLFQVTRLRLRATIYFGREWSAFPMGLVGSVIVGQ